MAGVRATRKLPVRRDDVVMVIAGDDRGKTGKVLRVLPLRRMAVVEGLNMVKRHMRKTQENPQGGVIEKEAPIPVSKLRGQVEAQDKKAKKTTAK
jgi:large subunit ribosomal protein L24